MNRTGVTSSAIALASLVMLGNATAAEATFPGRDGRITFVRNSQVHVMKPNGGDVRRLTRGEGGLWPAFSPDGRKIVFSRLGGPGSGAQDIAVVNANGRNLRVLTENGRYQEPAFAPSGRRIAFADNGHIDSISVDGGSSTQLTDDVDGYDDVTPTYSPRANRIAFVKRTHNPGFARIWVMRRDGTRERALTGRGGYYNAEPSYSPDGRRIAFIRYGQVWVMRADGTHQEKLTRFEIDRFQELSSPVFSPNGRRIAFVGPGTGSHEQVWVMKANGTRVHAVTNSRKHNSRMADWGPGR